MAKRYDRKQLMHRVQIAIRELHLSSWTQADKKRLYYVEQGLLALDEEQALLKTGIEELLEQFQKPTRITTGFGPQLSLSLQAAEKKVEALVGGLQKLVSEQRPRVKYPDRKLLEEPK